MHFSLLRKSSFPLFWLSICLLFFFFPIVPLKAAPAPNSKEACESKPKEGLCLDSCVSPRVPDGGCELDNKSVPCCVLGTTPNTTATPTTNASTTNASTTPATASSSESAPNPFDEKSPASFDTLKSYYGFQDPLNLQGKNKFSQLVNRVITWALPITGSLFLLMIVYSGILWLSAAGEMKQVTKAKTYLANAIIGMMLIVFSYAIVTNLIGYIGNAAF
ncbi:hypothetical protein IT408_03620 [Candidatus Uhrbacteria bacterium]|nr:hypothetical protein [Candidatus Uhrbacteria bacterium]